MPNKVCAMDLNRAFQVRHLIFLQFINIFIFLFFRKRFRNSESIDSLESVHNENNRAQMVALNPDDRRAGTSNEPGEQTESHSLNARNVNLDSVALSAPDIDAPPAYLEMDIPDQPPPAYSSLNLN